MHPRSTGTSSWIYASCHFIRDRLRREARVQPTATAATQCQRNRDNCCVRHSKRSRFRTVRTSAPAGCMRVALFPRHKGQIFDMLVSQQRQLYASGRRGVEHLQASTERSPRNLSTMALRCRASPKRRQREQSVKDLRKDYACVVSLFLRCLDKSRNILSVCCLAPFATGAGVVDGPRGTAYSNRLFLALGDALDCQVCT